MSTPLRLLGVLRNSAALDLGRVEIVVMDEADKLFELESGGGDNDDDMNVHTSSAVTRGRSRVAAVEEAGSEGGSRAGHKGKRGKTANGKHISKDDDDDDDDDMENEEDYDEPHVDSVSSAFLNQIDEILEKCPESGLQKALFSATIGPFVQELATSFLSNPVSITVGKVNAGAATIDQKLTFVGREDGKLLAIRQLIQQGDCECWS